MDKKESNQNHNPNPVLTANPLSRLFLWWLNPLFRRGYTRTLTEDDMYNVCPSDQSSVLGNRLEREWQKEIQRTKCRKSKASLSRVLFRIFGWEYLLFAILLFIREGAKICQPLILGRLIRYFTPDSTISKVEAYMYALAMSLCAMVLVMAFHPYVFHVMRIGMKMRLACNSVMYRKSLRLSSDGLSKTTSGQIINLMSNDVGKFDYAFVRMMYLILGPLDAIAIHVLLWQSLGPSVLAGFALLVLLGPLQALMGKLVSIFTLKIATHTDKRVRIMNEIIGGIQVIKFHCWEKPFGDLVAKVRRRETNQLRNLGYVRAVATGPFFISAKIMALAVFVTFSLVGGVISAEPVFVALSMYESVRLSATAYVCYAITQLSEVLVAIKRIETFLQLPEIEKDSSMKAEANQETGVELKGVTAQWHQTNKQRVLNNISASIKKETLLIVIGPVGAGKSSFLMTILGELPVVSGHVKVKGQVAYVSQQPWVFSGTLRQNIILRNPFIQEKYDTILQACALSKDVAVMPYGDMTLIGDRGMRLSGGQKSRINLARALYSDADVYLMDDPLSAVDTAVGRHIFKHVIKGLLKDKPRVLVAHQQQFLKYADEILILKQGEMVCSGTYGELTASGVDLKSFLKPTTECDAGSETSFNTTSLIVRSRRFSRLISVESMTENVTDPALTIGSEVEEQEAEERHEGSVGWRVYFTYLKAGAGLGWFLVFTFICLSVAGIYVLSDYWLSYWSKKEETVRSADVYLYENITINETVTGVDTYFYVSVYSGLIAGVFIFELMRALLFFRIAVEASKHLHNNMLVRLLKTQMRFFEINPAGRVLNRFSKDVGQIDNRIPDLFFNILQCGVMILSMVVVVGVVNPWTFIPVFPICFLLVIVRRYFLRTSRDVHRLEGTARSPVYSHVSASLDGLNTIRACRAQDNFAEEFDSHQDVHTKAYFLLIGTTTWLGMRLDFLSAIFLTAVSFCCVLAAGSLGPGLVGLTMTYAITGTGIFQWTVKSSADLENQTLRWILVAQGLVAETQVQSSMIMLPVPITDLDELLLGPVPQGHVAEPKFRQAIQQYLIRDGNGTFQMISVERVRDYSKLPTESSQEASKKPPADWPQHGAINAEQICLRYQPDSPLVLKNIAFAIKPKEKIGIIGKSGAGKSSLITVLFRLVEPEGKLTIDDIDIQNIGLHDLRNKISIIPQDPVLFKGKLRRNLDPFGEHDDTNLWQVLKEVQLFDSVKDLSEGLDTYVEEGGSNFSVGQRQLICLARAILQHNKILIIDEATANVDIRTDRLIQKTIREKFKDYTVLTVAHRLHTVIDSDKIMVLDDGRIVEFDVPYILLSKKDSFLSKMVRHTGCSDTKLLTEEAKSAYERKLSSAACQADAAAGVESERQASIRFYLPGEESSSIHDDVFSYNDLIVTRL